MTVMDQYQFSERITDEYNEKWKSVADCDESDYLPYLDGLDISDEQASELIRIVRNIMRMWAEMNLPADICGQIVESIIHPNPNESDSVE